MNERKIIWLEFGELKPLLKLSAQDLFHVQYNQLSILNNINFKILEH